VLDLHAVRPRAHVLQCVEVHFSTANWNPGTRSVFSFHSENKSFPAAVANATSDRHLADVAIARETGMRRPWRFHPGRKYGAGREVRLASPVGWTEASACWPDPRDHQRRRKKSAAGDPFSNRRAIDCWMDRGTSIRCPRPWRADC